MKCRLIKQHDQKDCGATCLAMVCSYFGYYAPLVKFRKLTQTGKNGTNIYNIINGAKELGLYSESLSGNFEELQDAIKAKDVTFPFIAHTVSEQGLQHFIIVKRIVKNKVYVLDPVIGGKIYTVAKFKDLWTGNIIVFTPTKEFTRKNERNPILKDCINIVFSDKKRLLSIIVASLLLLGVGLVGTYVYMYVVDTTSEYIISLDDIILQKMRVFFYSVLGLYGVGVIIQLLRGRIIANFSKKIDRDIMKMYYEQTLDLPMDFFSSRKTGEIISRYSDTQVVREVLADASVSLLLDTLMLFGGIYVMFSVSPKLLMITVIIILAYVAIIVVFRKKIKEVKEKAMEANAQMLSYFTEAVEGMETVKSLNGGGTVKYKLNGFMNKVVDHVFRGTIINNYRDTGMWLISVTSIVFILWSGSYEVMQGRLSIGGLITYNSMLGYFLSPLSNLINLQPSLQSAMVAAERLSDVLLIEKEELESGIEFNLSSRDIEIEKLGFRYVERKWVLKEVDMYIPWGKKVALIGESGSGKTTLAKLLVRMYEAQEGQIKIGEVSLKDFKTKSIRNKIIYVSQDIFLFADTIRNNLQLGGVSDISERKMKEICSKCLVDEFVQTLPLGYDTVLEENGMNLSGGQRQRLAIARAILRQPDILILDEATSNLDVITETAIIQTIEECHEGKTCIIIAHRLHTIKKCDSIYVMDKGRIVETGCHKELSTKKGKYYSLIQLMES